MAGAANYTGAVVVTLIGIVLSSVSLLPVAVDRLEFNSASLSRELQMWRSQGQYYVHNRSTPVFVHPIGPSRKPLGKLHGAVHAKQASMPPTPNVIVQARCKHCRHFLYR